MCIPFDDGRMSLTLSKQYRETGKLNALTEVFRMVSHYESVNPPLTFSSDFLSLSLFLGVTVCVLPLVPWLYMKWSAPLLLISSLRSVARSQARAL